MLLVPGGLGHVSPRDRLNEWSSLASVIVSGVLLVCGILLARAAARAGRRGETVLLALGTAIAGVPLFIAALLVALELITGGWSWGYPMSRDPVEGPRTKVARAAKSRRAPHLTIRGSRPRGASSREAI